MILYVSYINVVLVDMPGDAQNVAFQPDDANRKPISQVHRSGPFQSG